VKFKDGRVAVSTFPIIVFICDCYPRDCVERNAPSDLFHRSRRYHRWKNLGAPHAVGRPASSVILVYTRGDKGVCVCPCGESTAEVTTRYLSAQYTDLAMDWAIGGPGLDSQGRQRFLFAGGLGLTLAPTETPSR